jgi:ABC-type transport system substrate-binding protein
MLMLKRLFFLAILLLFLPGCDLLSGNQQDNPAAQFDVNRESAIYLRGGQPLTLDPALTHEAPSSALGHIFSGLVTLDTNLQVRPDLAAGWTVSEDGTLYTFHLRKNILFHNRRPLTAQDLIYSWERATDPALGSDTAQTYLGDIAGVAERLAGTAESISGLRAIDDHTLQVQLTAPVIYFLAKLAYPVTFVVDRENVSQADWEHQPNGTGPFRLQAWQDDEIMVLARHDAFYGEPARVAHLVILMGPGLSLAMYEQDELDLVGIGGDALARAQDPNSPLSAELRMVVDMCTSTIGLNNQLPPFDDVRVRQAFNYALDKQRLIEIFSEGNGLVARGALPPGMPGFAEDLVGYPYDPERARQLLVDYGQMPPVTFVMAGYDDVDAYTTAVISMWQENLGVTIEPLLIDPFNFFDELYGGNIGHIFSSGWCADYPDPQNFLDVLYHSQSPQNLGGFADPDVDQLLVQARVERDSAARLALYQEAEQQIVSQAPAVFVAHTVSAVLVKPRLQNYVLAPIGVTQWHTVSIHNDS